MALHGITGHQDIAVHRRASQGIPGLCRTSQAITGH
jgi:hypothetical protein